MGRFGVDPDLGEIVVAAVVFGLVFGPHLFHGLDGFTSLGPAVVEVAAHDLGLLPQPAGADTKDEPSARVEVQRSDLLGLDQGVVLWYQADAGAQHDLVSGSRGDGQTDEWVGHVAHGRWDAAVGGAAVFRCGVHRDDGVLSHPERFEPQVLRLLGECADVACFTVDGYVYPDFHRVSSESSS